MALLNFVISSYFLGLGGSTTVEDSPGITWHNNNIVPLFNHMIKTWVGLRMHSPARMRLSRDNGYQSWSPSQELELSMIPRAPLTSDLLMQVDFSSDLLSQLRHGLPPWLISNWTAVGLEVVQPN